MGLAPEAEREDIGSVAVEGVLREADVFECGHLGEGSQTPSPPNHLDGKVESDQ